MWHSANCIWAFVASGERVERAPRGLLLRPWALRWQRLGKASRPVRAEEGARETGLARRSVRG